MKEHRLELADIFRTHQQDFLARWNPVLSRQQRRALRDLRDCRTAALASPFRLTAAGCRMVWLAIGMEFYFYLLADIAPLRWATSCRLFSRLLCLLGRVSSS